MSKNNRGKVCLLDAKHGGRWWWVPTQVFQWKVQIERGSDGNEIPGTVFILPFYVASYLFFKLNYPKWDYKDGLACFEATKIKNWIKLLHSWPAVVVTKEVEVNYGDYKVFL